MHTTSTTQQLIRSVSVLISVRPAALSVIIHTSSERRKERHAYNPVNSPCHVTTS